MLLSPTDITKTNFCYEWVNATFNPLGINNITMWTELKRMTVQDLQDFNAVYIGGGNTFKLLNEVRENAFDAMLIDYISFGGVVYGGSAGAIS